MQECAAASGKYQYVPESFDVLQFEVAAYMVPFKT
jgi:hypothetical protein